MSVCCMYVCALPCGGQERTLDLLKLEVQMGCELPCGFWVLKPSPLQEHQVLLTTKWPASWELYVDGFCKGDTYGSHFILFCSCVLGHEFESKHLGGLERTWRVEMMQRQRHPHSIQITTALRVKTQRILKLRPSPSWLPSNKGLSNRVTPKKLLFRISRRFLCLASRTALWQPPSINHASLCRSPHQIWLATV